MRGKPGNEVNTTVTNKQTLHLFLLHMYSYYSAFIVAILLDMTSQMLYYTLPIASIVISEQLVRQVSLWVYEYVYTGVFCTKEHCTMYTTMHAFHCFYFKKNTTLIVYITEFSLKSGGQMHYCPPPYFLGGGGMAPWPPCGGPHVQNPRMRKCLVLEIPEFKVKECIEFAVNSHCSLKIAQLNALSRLRFSLQIHCRN